MEMQNAIKLLEASMQKYEQQGSDIATAIFEIMQQKKVTGLYITGSGPNAGTAMQAALIMSETTKLCFTGLPLAQYVRGPKETAENSIVINIIAKGKSYDRTQKSATTITAAGAHVFTVEEPGATENESVLHNIIPFNFMAFHLSKKLKVDTIFALGGKVT